MSASRPRSVNCERVAARGSVGELDGAGIERAADHARKRDIGLAERRGGNAAGGNRDRARSRALGHSGLIGQLLSLRTFDGAELIFPDLLRFKDFGRRDHILQGLGDFLWLTPIFGAVEREQLAVALRIGGERPFRCAAGGNLIDGAWVVAPALKDLAEGKAAVGLGLGPTLVGVLSEMVAPVFGDTTPLRVGLTLVTLSSAYGSWAFWRMSRHVAHDWMSAES